MSIRITKRALSAGFGAGTLAALLAEHASADTPFLNFAFPVTGGTARRTMPDRLVDIINVKDFGAVGDGTRDDTTAVQAAINAAAAKGTNRAGLSWNGATVYFPSGQYRITQQLTPPAGVSTCQVNLLGSGKRACVLLGEINDYLIYSNSWSRWFGVIEGFTIINSKGIFMNLTANLVIRDCVFHCAINALNLGGATADVYNTTVYNCIFQGGTDAHGIQTPGSVGIYSGQAEFYNISVTNYDIGFAGWNTGIVIIGSRFEVNNTAIVLGKAPPGGIDQLAAFQLSAISFERNDTSIYLQNAYTGELNGLALSGTVCPYFGPNFAFTDDIPIQSITWNGGVATITTTIPHLLGNYLSVVRGAGTTTFGGAIYNASNEGYNANAACTVTGTSTITYPLRTNPGSTATAGKIRVQPYIGLKVHSAGFVVLNGVNASSDYSNCGIDLSDRNLNAWGLVFIGCNANHNQGAGGQNWKMPPAPTNCGIDYIGCNNPRVILTFAQLPGQPGIASGASEGAEFNIIDGRKAGGGTAVMGDNVQGGGSQHLKVRYNGSNWTCMGV
jgi:hypothetical protein